MVPPLAPSPVEGAVACARCGAAHGSATMRLGRRELSLDAAAVSAVRRTAWGAVEVVCRACGHATPHRSGSVREAPAHAA